MKLKLIEIVNGYSIFSTIDEKLPIKLSWEVDDLLEILKKYVQRFDKERVELLKKFGEEIEDKPGTFKITDETNYLSEINKLAETEVELEFKQISLDSLDAAGVKLQHNAAQFIKPFVK
jgi:hypothetical protein